MWQKEKQKKPNIATKVILKLSVTTIIETHSKVHITTVKINN
jgi:hypothetical protein